MSPSQNALAPRKFRCIYCGSNGEWTGPGTPICNHCGASQPDGKTAAALQSGKPSGRAAKVCAAVAVLALVAGGAGWLVYRARPLGTPALHAGAAAKAPAATEVSASRIVRVEHPHIRQIAEKVEYTVDDLLAIPENAPPAPDFDMRLLVVKEPRRLRNEYGDTIFLGELVNTSPDQVALAPSVTLTVSRHGKKVDSAERHFPDLAPGAHVPVFFHYTGETRAFDAMSFDWKPAKAYTAGTARHPLLVATVQSQKLESSGAQPYRHAYKSMRVQGTIANKGDRKAQSVVVYVLLRDAQGRVTGYSHGELPSTLAPGATAPFEYSPIVWGEPAVSAEAVALTLLPPSL
jgi:hypothetical protein